MRERKETDKTPCYEESYTVFCTQVVETELIMNNGIMHMKDLLNRFIAKARETENIDATKYRAFQLKRRQKNSYPKLVFCSAKKRNTSEIVYAEDMDSS